MDKVKGIRVLGGDYYFLYVFIYELTKPLFYEWNIGNVVGLGSD